jgi:hypothetical protein
MHDRFKEKSRYLMQQDVNELRISSEKVREQATK